MKKSAKQWLVIPGVLATLAMQQVRGQEMVWESLAPADGEFGVVCTQDLGTVCSVPALESGYDGAWVFGNPWNGLAFTGMGQTFTLTTPGELQRIDLRIAQVGPDVPSGAFEVALYKFDLQAQKPTEKLAAIQALAQNYAFPLSNAPVSSFDFGPFHQALNANEPYALAVIPLADFSGGLLALQAGHDTYASGAAYRISAVPEPLACVMALAGLGVVGWGSGGYRLRLGRISIGK